MTVSKVRSDAEITAASALVWEFFDGLRERYPEMAVEIDEYVEAQDVAGELARFREVYGPPKGEAFLGYLEGEPSGTCFLKSYGENGGELNRMYVRSSGRGVGLGRALAQAVIDEARSLSFGFVYLGALYRHVEAIPLYESLGFRRFTDPTLLHGDNDRVIHMKLDLGTVA